MRLLKFVPKLGFLSRFFPSVLRKSNPSDALLYTLFFILFAFLLGYLLRFSQDSSSFLESVGIREVTALLTIALVMVSFDIVNDVVKAAINIEVTTKVKGKEEEFKRKLSATREEFESRMSDEVRSNRDLEFLALVQETTDRLDCFLGLSPAIQKKLNQSINGLLREVKEYRNRSIHRQEAVDSLSKGLSKGGDLMPAIIEACDAALGRKQGEPVTEELTRFRKDIHAYLKAWLICSIKYDECMPVQPISIDSSKRQQYIAALSHILSEVLEDEKIIPLLPVKAIREVIKEYLSRLISLLEEESISYQESLEGRSSD